MKLNYLMILNDFFNQTIPYFEFEKLLDDYIKTASPIDLQGFYDYITDNSFTEYNPDMVMLFYLHIWLLPNRLNQQHQICGADNMFTTFIKSIIDYYQTDLTKEVMTIDNNLNYQILKRGNLIIIFNTTEANIVIPLNKSMQNKTYFCVNCGEEIKINNNIDLYPYGFYILEDI